MIRRLLTRNPQDANAAFKELCTNGQLEIWTRWGRTSTTTEAQWLGRQAIRADLSVDGIIITIAACWARQGETLTRIQTRLMIMLEEMGAPVVPWSLMSHGDEPETPRIKAGGAGDDAKVSPELSFSPETNRITAESRRQARG